MKRILSVQLVFLSDISTIKISLTKLEDSDLKEGAKAAKAKIEELSKKHSYFWSTIAPVALLLNPTIEEEQKKKPRIRYIKQIRPNIL